MILFYTGALQAGVPQNIASKSLGGFISSTIVPNGLVGNIFLSLSKNEITDKIEQIRAIVLKNTFPTVKNNVKVWIETELGSKFDVKLGIVKNEDIFIDDCGNPYFESIQTNEQTPYYVEFENRNGEENAYTQATLSNNQYLGIWLKRTINDVVPPVIPPTGGFPTDCEIEFIELSSAGKDELVDFKLIIEWD